ncbi:DUF4326 domain-containing protein [Streptomyces sp. NPDC005775]|uniref:DUF4326 domain-containing protein n=1 Tax=Streptomyces sp. NPDC005775 TaxID=3364729 RepID=UPI00369788D4
MPEQPARLQRRRTKGWCKPTNTVIVTRPSRFGNPFTLAMAYDLGYAQSGETDLARRAVVGAFQEWLRGNRLMWQSKEGDTARQRLLDGLPELRGKNLACYCPLPAAGQPDHCHAAVLLQLANRPTP